MFHRSLLVLAFALLVPVSSASAVVAGTPARRADFPFFVVVGNGCGGTLVAPDRVLTAAHCREVVDARPSVRVGPSNIVRSVRLLAIHPVHVREQARMQREFPPGAADLMLLQLDRPVTGVPTLAPAAATPPVGASVVTIGRGATAPDQSGRGPFRSGVVAVQANASCADQLDTALTRRWSICTRDPRMADSSFKGPLVSACIGDSGGPLLVGDGIARRVVGVVSWGPACGIERDPEIYANAAEGRAFILARRPIWAPRASGRPRLVGTPRVGGTVRCSIPWIVRPDRPTIDFVSNGRQIASSSSPTYRIRAADAGQRLQCDALGSTAGGSYGTQLSASIRVAR